MYNVLLIYLLPTIIAYYFGYPLLLALLSTVGSTLYCWLYSLLLALLFIVGSTLYCWLYSLLLALLSTVAGYTLSTQDLAVPVMYSCKVM